MVVNDRRHGRRVGRRKEVEKEKNKTRSSTHVSAQVGPLISRTRQGNCVWGAEQLIIRNQKCFEVLSDKGDTAENVDDVHEFSDGLTETMSPLLPLSWFPDLPLRHIFVPHLEEQ